MFYITTHRKYWSLFRGKKILLNLSGDTNMAIFMDFNYFKGLFICKKSLNELDFTFLMF